jgi:serine/threonine protein kinase
MPGVVEAVYQKSVDIPNALRRGQKETPDGTTVPTLKGMLKIVFDVLEGTLILANNVLTLTHFAVLRYLHSDRNVIHRDISKGNILYLEDPICPPADAGYGWQDAEPKEVHCPLCFIKYLLCARYVQIDRWDWSY